MEIRNLSSYLSLRLLARFVVVFSLVLMPGCAGILPMDMQRSLTQVAPKKIDFRELEYFALRSRASYTSPENIKRKFPDTTLVKTISDIDVLYFLETDPRNRTQTITIRGTANKPNIWEDAEILLVKDSFLGFWLHRGFQNDSLKVFNDVKPHLNNDYEIRVTGHSLGGAIALILTNYLYKDGYMVERLVTFGQPKVTKDKSDSLYWRANPSLRKITRVVRPNDPIPMIPPAGLAIRYGHVGPELILEKGQDYVFLDAHDADRLSVGEFWRNLGRVHLKDHSMELYLKNIQGKVRKGAHQVPYKGS
ncbi:lipase family protein [Rhizobiales bacterium]|uniref:lipase family protein n=1 Tax=Hongsoonwoonella zoysiae TaxID=2821844 RepID=UPI00155FBF24|nr:lipase family protein [Hongsoonwoonella zoysiae]NRG16095.1 lipase family protein [Hongsoonwoonella zoysiae]